ncbi:MAG: hypothetical protein ACPLXS_03415 [Candidatus Micrarchaeales archaeon]
MEEIIKEIMKSGFKIRRIFEKDNEIIIDFKHKNIEEEEPIFFSSIEIDKEKNTISGTIRYRPRGDYASFEISEPFIIPHAYFKDRILSITFRNFSKDRLDELLSSALTYS